MKRLVIVAAFVVGLVTPALGQDFFAGKAAYSRGDYAAALKELGPLAEQGDAGSQSLVGLMNEEGLGVPQDFAEAVRWYRKAADQGVALAQNRLGAMYANGQGIRQDYVLAHMWLNLAVSRFPSAEIRDLGSEALDAVASRMTPAQIAEAQRLAREWRPKVGLVLPALANDGAMCHRLVETTFIDGSLIRGCEPGDVLVVQMTSNVAPAPIVGRYCDLRHAVWSEKTAEGQVTVVCVFHGERRRR